VDTAAAAAAAAVAAVAGTVEEVPSSLRMILNLKMTGWDRLKAAHCLMCCC
jgi:hypothetical protein